MQPDRLVDIPLQIGAYTIERELGRGEFGCVYLASRPGIERPVAIKVLRADRATADVRERFRAERAALGMLESRHVARILDAGDAGDVPFLVMEHVPGAPLVADCDQHRRSLSQRIALFQQACEGVEHAHQRRIIHRDLKPEHVLVVDEDGTPTPKVIDWGLARGEDFLLVPGQATLDGHVLGALLYMSPEQASGRRQLVDTRTDIYALGVILYELVAGCLPYDRDSLAGLSVSEAMSRLHSPDRLPPRPSARLQALDPDIAAAIADARRTGVGELLQALRGDLDWIVMRAMAPERERRYPTATALATDLGRFLQHLPVEARPPSRTYRLGKFVRRNRGAVVAAVAAAVVLVGSTVGASVGMAQARDIAQLAGDKERLALENERLALARVAEAEARRAASARAQFQAGLLAAQRGAWPAALEQYAQARSGGYHDPVELSIREIEALEGDRQHERAAAAMAALCAEGDRLGRHRATVLLLAADLGVNRMRDPDAKLELARAAWQLDQAAPGMLSPADAAYAQALLAETPGAALAHLRRARDLDRYHRRANTAYAITLLLTGRLAEATLFAESFRTLHPDDPEVALYAMVVAGLAGAQDLDDRIDQIDRRHGANVAAVARFVAEVIGFAAWGNSVFQRQACTVTAGSFDFVPTAGQLLLRTAALLGRFRDVEDGTGLLDGQLLHRVPPALVACYQRLGQPLLGQGLRLDALLQAVAAIPADAELDGSLLLLKAMHTAGSRGLAAALPDLQAAVAQPSAILQRRTVLLMGIVLATAAAAGAPPGSATLAAVTEQARPWLTEMLELEGMPDDQFRRLHQAVRILHCDDLRDELLGRWLRLHPTSTAARMARLEVLLELDAAPSAEQLWQELDRAGGADPVLMERARQALDRTRGR